MSEMTLPTPKKCYEKTSYYNQKIYGMSRVTWPTCIYLKNGKCQLNGCIKNTRGNAPSLTDEEKAYEKGKEDGIKTFIRELLSGKE